MKFAPLTTVGISVAVDDVNKAKLLGNHFSGAHRVDVGMHGKLDILLLPPDINNTQI